MPYHAITEYVRWDEQQTERPSSAMLCARQLGRVEPQGPPMIYLQHAARTIKAEVPPDKLSKADTDLLFLIYAALMFAKARLSHGKTYITLGRPGQLTVAKTANRSYRSISLPRTCKPRTSRLWMPSQPWQSATERRASRLEQYAPVTRRRRSPCGMRSVSSPTRELGRARPSSATAEQHPGVPAGLRLLHPPHLRAVGPAGTACPHVGRRSGGRAGQPSVLRPARDAGPGTWLVPA